MGTRGPVPKRAEARMGHHKTKSDREELEQVPVIGRVAALPADEDWHPVARRWYGSLSESGQAQFYEPSDWATAFYVAEAMSKNLLQGKFSAMLFNSVMSSMADLLVTEGSRRRVQVELQRVDVEAAAEQVKGAKIHDLRSRLSG